MMDGQAEQPHVEVVVRTGTEDICVIGFWAEGKNSVAVALGITDPAMGESVAVTLAEAAAALRGTVWEDAAVTPDVIRRILDSDEKGEHPF
jgi:hypothetical protein